MHRIMLVVKKSEQAEQVAVALQTWLEQQGRAVKMLQADSVNGQQSENEPEIEQADEFDLVVVLGGDGTLLYAARTIGCLGIPLLGVNLGGLGFMTEIGLPDLYPALKRVLNRDYITEARMMLTAEVIRDGLTEARHTVLNDVVINKGALARILDLNVLVDNTHLTRSRADGLIISTPTGSTAYNLSAGGPIVHPAHESVILTPICPFTLSNRPLILPAEATIEVEIDPHTIDVFLTSDGQVSFPLAPGDKLVVRQSENRISLIKNPYKNYFEILRTKLGWA